MRRASTTRELNRLAADLADEYLRAIVLAGGIYGRRHAERAEQLMDAMIETLLLPVATDERPGVPTPSARPGRPTRPA